MFVDTQYPPIPTILQYFNMKVIGRYSQGIELFSNITFGLSMFLPIFEITKTKISKLAGIVTLVVLPMIFSVFQFYQNLQVDGLIGIVMAFIIYFFFTEKNKKALLFEMLFGFFILSLIKPIGIGISAVVIFAFIIYEIIKNIFVEKNKFKEFIFSKRMKIIYASILISLLAFGSWSIYTKVTMNVGISAIESVDTRLEEGETKLDFVLNSYKSVYTGEGTPNEKAASFMIKDFAKRTANLGLLIPLFDFMYIVNTYEICTALIIILLTIIIVRIIRNNKIKNINKSTKNKNNKKEINIDRKTSKLFIYLITLAIMFLVYCFLFQLAYVAVFSIKEIMMMASFDRYVSSILIAFIYFTIFELIKFSNIFKEKKIINYGISLFIIIILIINTSRFSFNKLFNFNGYNEETNKIISSYKDTYNIIENNIPVNAKIMLVAQSALKAEDANRVRYFLYPREVGSFVVLTDIGKYDAKSFGKIATEMYDYVYILDTDKYLTENSKEYFEGTEAKDETLYKVNENGKLEELK